MEILKMLATGREVTSYRVDFSKHIGGVVNTILLQEIINKEVLGENNYGCIEEIAENLWFTKKEATKALKKLVSLGLVNQKIDDNGLLLSINVSNLKKLVLEKL